MTLSHKSITIATFFGQLARLVAIQIAKKCWLNGLTEGVKLWDKDVWSIKFHVQDSLRSLMRCYGPLAFLDLAMVLACCISSEAIVSFIVVQQMILMSSILPQGISKAAQILIKDSIYAMKPENAKTYTQTTWYFAAVTALIVATATYLCKAMILDQYS